MNTRQPLDRHARDLDPQVQKAVHHAARLKSDGRRFTLDRDFEDGPELQRQSGAIRRHTIDHLDTYLEMAEASLRRNNAQVHWATDAASARDRILTLLKERGATRVVKAKSMATEEIHLNPYLQEHGIETVETDLGEFIVQLDGDRPSHIVTPIIHKNRAASARCLERNGLGPYNDEPEVITRRARDYLRQKFLSADAGITGANLVSAESGRILIVTNEGNGRFCTAAPRLHIVLVGIEKLIPSDADFPVFLAMLGRTATAQRLSVYTQFVGGPRREADAQGKPAPEMHVVFLDNGRSKILATREREILQCIRCGGCLNICPVYRQASGHAYRSVYPGPIGSVLTPLLRMDQFGDWADLPKASSLCGACQEVCPANIPIPDLLLQLRDKAKREGVKKASIQTPPFGLWARAASAPGLWRIALPLSRLLNGIPHALFSLHPAGKRWRQEGRDLPRFRGGAFRRWIRTRPPPSSADERLQP